MISGGQTRLTSSDDGINISGDNPQGFTIAGGAVTIDSEGDGLDSNAAGTISGAASWSSDPPWGETARSTCSRG